MEAYTNFAEVYDTFMDNVPYEQWTEYIKETLKEDGIVDGLVLELGCGTGSMTERLAEAPFDFRFRRQSSYRIDHNDVDGC